MNRTLRFVGFLLVLVAGADLLWGASRILVSAIRGNGPGIMAFDSAGRGYSATVGSGLVLDATTRSLSATAVSAAAPVRAVYRATSGQTIYNVPSPSGGVTTAPKDVWVYQNGIILAVTEDYTIGADSKTVVLLQAADLTGGSEIVQVVAWY